MFKNIVILWGVWQGAGEIMCVSETYKLVPFEPLAPSFSFTASQITALLLRSIYNVHQGVIMAPRWSYILQGENDRKEKSTSNRAITFKREHLPGGCWCHTMQLCMKSLVFRWTCTKAQRWVDECLGETMWSQEFTGESLTIVFQ